jgi:hypothetical protein
MAVMAKSESVCRNVVISTENENGISIGNNQTKAKKLMAIWKEKRNGNNENVS